MYMDCTCAVYLGTGHGTNKIQLRSSYRYSTQPVPVLYCTLQLYCTCSPGSASRSRSNHLHGKLFQSVRLVLMRVTAMPSAPINRQCLNNSGSAIVWSKSTDSTPGSSDAQIQRDLSPNGLYLCSTGSSICRSYVQCIFRYYNRRLSICTVMQ